MNCVKERTTRKLYSAEIHRKETKKGFVGGRVTDIEAQRRRKRRERSKQR